MAEPHPHNVVKITRTRHKRRAGAAAAVSDGAGMLGALATMVWQRKLWWMVPLLLTLLLVGGLLLMEATPLGPLIYPMF